MPRPRTNSTEGFGSDSFLDIVCNMVGIIILLVLVVGLRIKDAPVSLSSDAEAAPAATPPVTAISTAPLQDLQRQIGLGQTQLAISEQQQRQLKQDLAAARQAAAKQDVDNRRAQEQLAQTQQWESELQRALLAKQEQLRALALAVQSVPGARPAKTVQLETYPAPVSRSVAGDEAHFQLLGGRIVHVPFKALVEKFKADARAKVQASPSSTQIEAVVGPIENFNLRYVLHSQGYGRFALERFSFIPLSNRMGETAEEALAPGARFRQVLATYDPNHTTVTLWVYQDSFDAFRLIRKDAYVLGYSTAARPLPMGQLISGSPDGSRSAAQ